MKHIGVLLFLLAGWTAAAQSNFVAGTLTKRNLQSIKGEIDYRDWVANPKEIYFKQSPSAKVQTFTVEDLESFSIEYNGELYVRAEVSYIDEPTEDDDDLMVLSSEADFFQAPRLKQETVFLQTMVQGKLNLYYLYGERGRPHYFVKKDDQDFQELAFRRVKTNGKFTANNVPDVTLGDSPGTLEFHTYKRQLKDLMSDQVGFASRIGKTSYSVQLVDLVKMYNQKAGDLVFVRQKGGPQLSVYLIAGLARGTFRVNDAILPRDTYGNSKISPTFGAGIDWILPRTNGKFGVRFEGSYQDEGVIYTTKHRFYDEDEKVLGYDINVKALRLNGQLKFNFFNRPFSPYVALGFGYSKLMNGQYIRQEIDKRDPNETTTLERDLKSGDGYISGILGVKWNNLFLEGRYENGGNLMDYQTESLRLNRMVVAAGYSFRF